MSGGLDSQNKSPTIKTEDLGSTLFELNAQVTAEPGTTDQEQMS